MVATSTLQPGSDRTGREQRLVRTAVGLGAIVVAFAVAFYPSHLFIAGEWSSSSGALSHGYLILAISVVLLVRLVPVVAATEQRPAWWVLLFLFGLSVAWLLGYVATVAAVQTVVLPAILLLACAAAYGIRATRPIAFPILFIYFAIPAVDHLNFIFQAITVYAVGVLLRLVDLPALLYGNYVELASGKFVIEGGCSGLSFIIAGLSLAVLYGYLYYSNYKQRFALIVLTAVATMFGNWLRVFAIIIIGYRTDMQSSLVDDHLTFGWVIFGLLMIPVYFFARWLEGDHHPAEPFIVPSGESNPRRNDWVAPVIAIAAMIAGPLWAMATKHPEITAENIRLELPAGSQTWGGPAESVWGWHPRFAGPSIERVAQYGDRAAPVLAYTNLYLSQEQNRELVYFNNSVQGNWRNANLDVPVAKSVEMPGGEQFRQLAARNYTGNWLIWYRYQIGEQFEISDWRAKMTQALNSLRGRPAAGIIAFATPCAASCRDAEARLTEFFEQVGRKVRVDYGRGEK